jgi:hypothetical protein
MAGSGAKKEKGLRFRKPLIVLRARPTYFG